MADPDPKAPTAPSENAPLRGTPQPAAAAPPPAHAPKVKRMGARSREPVWGLRKPLPQAWRWPLTLLLPTVILVAWIAVTSGAKPLVGELFLPSPSSVLHSLRDLFLRDQCTANGCSVVDSYLFQCIWASSRRIVWSFALAAATAIPIGVLMGSWEPINRMLDPIMAPLRYMPISAFIPLLILWLGIYESQKIAFLYLGVFVYLLPVVVAAIRAVPEELVQTALTLGANRTQVVLTVLVRQAMPDVFESLRVMNAISWTYVILAEFVNAKVGLGYLIQVAGDHLKTAEVFAGILVIGVIGLTTDALIRMANRALFAWRSEEPA